MTESTSHDGGSSTNDLVGSATGLVGIAVVPTLFINGRRHTGPDDARSLIRALEDTAGPANLVQ